MATINDLYNAVNELDIQYLVETSLIDTEPDYIELQKKQLALGLRSDDKNIFNLKTGKDTYSPAYAKKKGRPEKPIILFNTGDWQNDIFVDVRSDILVTESADSKNDLLQTTYGEQILGLGMNAKEEYIEIVGPVFIENVQNALSK